MKQDIEKVALTSLLYGGWHYGGHELTVHDFTTENNRAVFLAVERLAKNGKDIDPFIVQDALTFDIHDLACGHASPKTMKAYVDSLKDATLKRELLRVGNTILSGQGAGIEQLLQAQSLLSSLEGTASTDVIPIGKHVDDWWQELGNRAEGGKWLRTGFCDVDKRIGGMRGGDLVIVAGRPAMGKTVLALNIAMQCRQKSAFFSLEMQAEGLLDRVAASLAKVPLGVIRSGQLDKEQWARVTSASAQIRELPIHLDETSGLTIEEIHARARSLKAKEGLSLVVVDYLQLIASDRGQGSYEKVTHISQMSKRMAKDLGVPVLMLAQLSRKCEERQDKRPLMSDLRDSGSIEQDADVVAFVYRDQVYDENSTFGNHAELIFRKVRQGSIGTDWFLFDGEHQTFKQAVRPNIETPQVKGPYAAKEWGK